MTKQEWPNVCWDALKMTFGVFLNCQMFNREEEFSALSSKNKVADVK